MLKKLQILVLLTIFLPSLNSCGTGVDAKQFPPDPKERVKKNIEEGRGFTIMGGVKNRGGSGEFDFASSNELWRASLDTIDFMPLVSANYSGGIIITDWYSSGSNVNESIKISIRFLTNEIRSDALDINIFTKKCDERNNCTVIEGNNEIVTSLKKSILKKAAKFEDSDLAKKRKENTYKREIKD